MQPNSTKFNRFSWPWTKLKSIPTYSMFHVSYDKESQSLIAIPIFMDAVIFKYSFSKDLWEEYTIQPINQTLITVKILATIKDNKIYLISQNEQLVVLELMKHTNRCTIQFIQNPNFLKNLFKLPSRAYYATTSIQDEFYYISNKHFIKYNIKTNKHQILRNSSMQHTDRKSIIPVKNKLILFCQIDWVILSIQQYNIKNNHWKLLPVKSSYNIRIILATTILRQQMILIVAQDSPLHYFLAVYEIQSKTLTRKAINLPQPCTNLFAVNDKNKDILITKTWIQNQFKKQIPACIEAMITKYYINEMIHIIGNNNRHYQLDVIQILNNA